MPGMLCLNIWGNMLIERMDDIIECNYLGYAQSFQMLYLISTYCVIFVYIIFLLTVKETLKRYYAYMERSQEDMERRLNLHQMQVSIIKGRSYQDWCDALAYSLYPIHKGRIGSNAEREYIAADRAARQYKRLASSIKEFRFDEAEDDEDYEISSNGPITPTSETKLNKSKSEQFSGY